MRDIKFRGKRLDNGEWLYGQLFVFDSETYIIPSGWGGGGIRQFKVHPETVGQYIGISDCFGRDIYDGDLLNIHDSHETIGEVVWLPNEMRFALERIVKDGEQVPSEYAVYDLYARKGKRYEVIGNVHDTMLYSLPEWAELEQEYGNYYEAHIKPSLRSYFAEHSPADIFDEIEPEDWRKCKILRINDTADDNAMLEFWVYRVSPNLLTLGFAGRMKG